MSALIRYLAESVNDLWYVFDTHDPAMMQASTLGCVGVNDILMTDSQTVAEFCADALNAAQDNGVNASAGKRSQCTHHHHNHYMGSILCLDCNAVLPQ